MIKTSNHLVRSRAVLMSLVFVASFAVQAFAQDRILNLESYNQNRVARLAPDAVNAQVSFTVDGGTRVRFHVRSTADGISAAITSPNGQTVNANNIGGLGGQYRTYQVAPEDGDFFFNPDYLMGYHQIFDFPLQGTGQYTVSFAAPAGNTQEIAVITDVVADSGLNAKLFAAQSSVVLGKLINFSLALFDEQSPINGATLAAQIQLPNGTSVSLPFADNGIGVDYEAGDGMYSASYVPNVAGDHTVSVQISGIRASSAHFSTTAYTNFAVRPYVGKLTGTFQDFGVDSDGDNLFEKLVVRPEIEAAQAGEYEAYVHLKTASGKYLVRSGRAEVETPGLSHINVDFDAQSIIALDENGPYTIELLELVKHQGQGTEDLDERTNVGQTQPYQKSQFQRDGIILTNSNIVEGVDLNGNGKFEFLSIKVGVNVLRTGRYLVAGTLFDQNDGRIDGYYSGGINLLAGDNYVQFYYSGPGIYAHGVSGTFRLKNVLIRELKDTDENTYTGAVFAASTLLETTPFDINQFESVGSINQLGQNVAFGIDRNGDGKFDVLRTESLVHFPFPPGGGAYEYEIEGDLTDANGTVIDTEYIAGGTEYGIVLFQEGFNQISFEFKGWKINNQGANGPYSVKSVRILRRSNPPLLTVLNSLFNTQAFTPEQFESAATLELTELRLNITAGDGDESFEPGETAEVTTRFKNLGAGAARSLSGVLSTLSPDIEVINGNSGYPNVNAAGEVVNAVPYAIKFKNGSPPDISFDLGLQLGYNAGQTKAVSIFLQTGSRVQKVLATGVVGGKQQIFSLSSDGSSKLNLSDSAFDDNRAVWSRDGSKIAFTRQDKLWVMNADGSGKVELSTLPTYDVPSWSPTSDKILFAAGSGSADLYTINSDGTGLTQISNTPSLNESDAKWSPNGSKIAFKLGYELHTINPDGTGMTSLATGGYTDYQWSPYGNQIAWKFDRSISVVNPDGTQKRAIVQYNGAEFWGFSRSISWSPDGLKIAYGMTTGPGTATVAKIHSVAVDTGQAVEIPGFRSTEEISWSRDGRLLAVTGVPIEGGPADNYRLYAVNVADGRRVGLLEPLSVPTDVAWKPVQEADFLAPITSAAVSPAPNSQGWNKENSTVNMSALDNPGGSGVRDINYSASGAQAIPPTVVPGSAGVAVITAEGVTTVTYFAADNATNFETARSLAVKIDKTAPTSSHSYSIARKTATVILTGTDGGSGVGGISYKVDSGSYTSYGSPFVITVPGDHTVTYYATDVAGNIEPEKAFTLNVPNQAAPEVSFIAPESNAVLDNPASFNLQARIDYVDGGLAAVEFFDGATKIADGTQDTTDIYQGAWNGPTLGGHNLRVVVTGNNGLTGSAEAPVTVLSNLPSPWIGKQIGTDVYIGSPSFAANTFVIPGVSSAASSTFDRLNFVHQPLAGDGTVSARLVSLDAPGSVKAGLMIRESLDANARYVALLYDQSGKPIFQRRTTVGGGVSTTNGTVAGTPYWLMLVRKGNQFNLYISNDGSTWNLFNSLSLTIGTNAFVGLVNISDGGTGYFDNVVTAAGNLLPQASLTAPVDGTSTNQGTNVTLTATATDGDGTVSRVDFYDGDSLLGSDSSSPYSFVWNNVASGVHRLSARAVDNAVGSASSGIAVVNVNPTTTKTLIPIADAYVKDGSGASTNFGTATTLQVRTSATSGNNHDTYFKFDAAGVGTVGRAKLRVYAALSASGTMDTSVYPVANTAWVETGTSGIRWNNKPPLGTVIGGSVSVASTSYRWYEFDVTNYVQSEKAAGRNTISLALHNTANTSPYLKVNSREAGSGVAELFIEPTAGNTAPTVSLTSPLSDSVHSSGGSVTLLATANDPDGSVSKVEFYAGTRLVGSSTTAPYQFIWNNLPTGVHTLTAKAIDNTNAVVSSAPTAIEVYNSGGSVSGTQLNPIADTYVTSDTGAGFGTVSPLIASSFTNSQTGVQTFRNAYLKFDTTSVGSISSAKLRVYAATFNWNVNRLFAHSVIESAWSEPDMRWFNKPALGKTLRELHVSGRAYQWYEIDVTAYVLAEKAAGRHVLSFGLRENAYDGFNIFSREAAYNRPVLIANP